MLSNVPNNVSPSNSMTSGEPTISPDDPQTPTCSLQNTTSPLDIGNKVQREDLSDLSEAECENSCQLNNSCPELATHIAPPLPASSLVTANVSCITCIPTGNGEHKVKLKRGRKPKNLEPLTSVSGPFTIPLRDQISEISRTFREQPGPPFRCPLCLKIYFSYSGVLYHLRNNTHSEAAILENRKKMARSRRKPKTSAEGQKFAEVEIENEIYRLSFEKYIHFEVTDVPPSPLTPKKSKICMPRQTSPAKNSPKTLRGQYSPDKAPPPEASFKLVTERDHIRHGATMPLNYIQYIEKTSEDMAMFVEYEMDEEDIAWLSLVNDKRNRDDLAPISYDLFELIMDKFEKVCVFETSADGTVPIQNSFDPLNNIDENAVCSICSDGEAQNTNMILFCDMCNIPVHQECYGVPYIPEGQWLCSSLFAYAKPALCLGRRCQLSPSCGVDCVLCPNKPGAFKQTDDGRWSHVICALWIPEVQFANPVFLEPIDGLKNIPPARWKLLCYICGLKGPCIQCSRQNCYLAFHVTCAQDSSLYMRIEALDEIGGTLRKLAYCVNHGPDGIQKRGRKKIPRRLSEHEKDKMKDEKEGNEHKKDSKNVGRPKKQLNIPLPLPTISVPKIPDTKIKEIVQKIELQDKEDIVAKLKHYWMLKRHMRNGVPLIRRLATITQQKLNHQDLSIEELTELKEKFFLLRRVRTDLEKVRMLVQLTYKRERVKREKAKVLYQSSELELAPLHRLMSLVLEKLIDRDVAKIFTQPVDIQDVPDYGEVVKEPIDISTVKEKLENFDYPDVDLFMKDIYRIWENAKCYNKEESVYTRAANRMEKFTEVLFNWLDQKSKELNVDSKTGFLRKSPPQRKNGKPADEYLRLSPDDQVRQLQDMLDETRAILSSATTRKALVRNLKEQILTLVSEYGLKDVNFEHKFSESDSVATEPGRVETPTPNKKRRRVEIDTTPSDIRASLRMTAGRRAALSSARLNSSELNPPSSPDMKRVRQDSEKEESVLEPLPSSQETVATNVSSDKGSLRSNSGKKKKRHAYYYRLSHEKPKKVTKKRHNSEVSSGTEQILENNSPATPDNLTPSQNTDENLKDFTDARPRTRSMSQTMDLPPLFYHPDPHLLVTHKIRTLFSDQTPPSSSLLCETPTRQQSPSEDESIPQRVTRQRCRDDHLQVIPEAQLLSLSIQTNRKDTSVNDSRSDDLDNNNEFWDFHHLDLVWAKCAGYPSYPAIVVDPKLAKQTSKLKDQSIPVPKKEVLADKSAKPEFLLVNFFDSKRTWQWLPPSKLLPLGADDTDDSKLKEVKGSHLKVSVQEAYTRANKFACDKHSTQISN